MDERLGLLGLREREEDLPLAGAPLLERQSSRGLQRVDNRHRRLEITACLASEIAAGGKHPGDRARRRKLVSSGTRLGKRFASCSHLAREGSPPGSEITFDDAVDQSRVERVGGFDWLAR